MAWRQLSDVQWDQIRRHLPGPSRLQRVDDGSPMPATVSKAYSGFSGPGLLGANGDDMAAPVYLLATPAAAGTQWGAAGPMAGLARPAQ